MLDYTKLVSKLLPQDQVSGDPGLQLRAGVVDALNLDGTVDVALSGAIVEDVPRLGEASIQVGAVVQILVYRGSMLILGQVALGTAGQTAGLGLWARGQATGSSGLIGTTQVPLIPTNTVTFIKNRVYECRTHGGVQSSTAGLYLDLRAYRSAPVATQIGEFFRFPAPVISVAFNAGASGLYFTTAANVTGGVTLYGAASVAGAVTHVGTATGTPRNIEVYDVGDISQFTGIATW